MVTFRSLDVFVVGLIVVVSFLACLIFFHEDQSFLRGYKKIEIGMNLNEIEEILGPGQEVPQRNVPQIPFQGKFAYVVQGDKIYIWKGPYDELIYVGVSQGKISGKSYQERTSH